MNTPFAITLDILTSLTNHTGTWRTERPEYIQGLPPCSHACPAGEQVQGWLYDAEDGSYEAAWTRLVQDNPLPAVMGRICYRPCEAACNRAQLDSAVGINSVERFLGDHAIQEKWSLPAPGRPTGRRVLVVGGGPAGLAAAYHLRLLGHEVSLHDSAARPGGMMRAAIPPFRLPRDVLDAEVDRILALGIDLTSGVPVTDVAALMRTERCDAAFLAIGAQLSHRAYVPAVQAAATLEALALLGQVAAGERPALGHTVLVYGGGNTAMDAARTARRLGASDAVVIYRRTRDRMPADDVEVREASEEGVAMRWLRTIAPGGTDSVRLERMRLDENGAPVGTGEYEQLDADTVVLALGEDVDRSLVGRLPGLTVRNGVIAVDERLRTGHEGIFAGGDATGTVRSATAAVGTGTKAARSIDAYLRGVPVGAPDSRVPVPFGRLNTWYFTDAPHAIRPRLAAARRIHDFAEVVSGLDRDTAQYEARRCLSCGNCFGCDNCFGVCPDNAVHKVDTGTGYEIDYDFCKGCGLCVAECPCGAIELRPEPT
jgi:NADPH-dependent glutamate synthase beta subunit-like oxidoreductase